ncbi:MAG: M48 family metallopeptidase [Clostridia bacterium]|nr:M48 family metallopeptidase [Clostridia bacterium]
MKKQKTVEETFTYVKYGLLFTVRLVKTFRNSYSIRVNSKDTLTVRAPLFATQTGVTALLDKHFNWIEKRIPAAISQTENGKAPDEEQIKELADKAKEYLGIRLPYFARLLDVRYNNVTVRCQKTRWGSCSAKGNLNFNCLLSLAPTEVFDYVIVHELCHLKEMNHSPAFWHEVEKIIPDRKINEKWLRKNGSALLSLAKKI